MSKKLTSLASALKGFDLNPEQRIAVEAISNHQISILRGAAGTSKSFSAVYAALRLLSTRYSGIDRISVTRPLVATEKMGFLPGTLGEKVRPYMLPMVEFFNMLGDSGDKTYEGMLASGKLMERPIAFLRGATISGEILIVDEAQNVSPDQMLMILTRIGVSGKLVVTGDTNQSDLPKGSPSGLDYLIALAERLPYIADIEMTINMRSEMISEIIENWGIGI